MKTHQSPRLQPLTPPDLAHIRDLAAVHSAGLERRCARYRRCAGISRTAVAACLLAVSAFGADTVYTDPPYTGKAVFGDITPEHASDAVNVMLDQI